MAYTATATHNSNGSTTLCYRDKEQTFPKLSKAIRFAHKIGEVVDGWEPFLTDDSKIKSAKNKRRFQSFFKNGMPTKVRCYSNDGETLDRYTIVFTGNYRRLTAGMFHSLGCSGCPGHPHGIGYFSEDKTQIDKPNYGPLGVKITFAELPSDVQKYVLSYYLNLWNFTTDAGDWK